MRRVSSLVLSLIVPVVLFSCAKTEQAPIALPASDSGVSTPLVASGSSVESLPQPNELSAQFSYVYGYQVAKAILGEYPLDASYIAKGILDGAKGSSPYFAADKMQAIMEEYIAKLQKEQEAQISALRSANLEKANSFLETNKTRAGVISLDDKLQYEILRAGNEGGKKPTEKSTVTMDYQLVLLSGAVMDSSYERGTPSSMDLSRTIPGFSRALLEMSEGEKIRLWVHPDLGYGENGTNSIEPNALLIFDIELRSVDSNPLE